MTTTTSTSTVDEASATTGSPREAARVVERWLPELTAHVVERGVEHVTLRGLASAVGTSHRMLSYYFGSLNALLAAVADELRRRRVVALSAGAHTRRELLERAWQTSRDADARVITQIYFRVAAQGGLGDHALVGHVDNDWLEPLARAGVAEGLPVEDARTQARLLSAAGRGLLLDDLAGASWEESERALQLLLDLTCGPRA